MRDLIDQARAEVENAGALIDEILFLSELESGTRDRLARPHERAARARESRRATSRTQPRARAWSCGVEGDPTSIVPLRPRMLRMVVENLAENAIRYAGHGARFTLSIRRSGEFARPDRRRRRPRRRRGDARRGSSSASTATDPARTSRGTGLGLAIVKHVVAAAGGEVEADGGPGRGLRIRCIFPS